MSIPQIAAFLFFLSLLLIKSMGLDAKARQNYLEYHAGTIAAEEAITHERYGQALDIYDHLFVDYEFVFLRDLKIAAQLAVQTGNEEKAIDYLQAGIASGWEMKAIRKTKFLDRLRQNARWEIVQNDYDSLHAAYLERLDLKLRDDVHTMYKTDQGKAFIGLFALGNKARDRYASRKFAPHGRKQMAHFEKIMAQHGYPGEKLIGNNYWMETVLVHHNSMTAVLARQDTIYPRLRPRLLRAVELGQMSPAEFAVIDNWYIAVKSERRESSYGNLEGIINTKAELVRANEIRRKIGLRSVEIRNGLIDIQAKTGMNFYLPEWPERNQKIEINNFL